jgi:hypothetical protein
MLHLVPRVLPGFSGSYYTAYGRKMEAKQFDKIRQTGSQTEVCQTEV